MTRLPGYLVVHMVRFAWRQDIQKKAKIMVRAAPQPSHSSHSPFLLPPASQRKVKFPLEFDALDLAADELKTKLLPVSRKLKEVEKERAERRKVRKRTKGAVPAASASTAVATTDVEMGDAAAVVAVEAPTNEATLEKGKTLAGGELEEESVYRTRERQELEALISNDVKHDIGASISGLYDLVCESIHLQLLAWTLFNFRCSHCDAQGCRCRRRALHRLCQKERLPRIQGCYCGCVVSLSGPCRCRGSGRNLV